jgi:homopolymeric O-antigen transport system permease protein
MSAVATRTQTAPAPAPAPARLPQNAPIHVIEPWKPGVLARLREVWRQRRLIPYYGKCFIQKRYQNTWLGWIWLPLRPGLDMLSKALFFGGFLGVSSGDRPYIIFFTFGSCGWVLFESMSRWGMRGLRMSDRFIRHAYAPRLPRMMGTFGAAGLDFALYTVVAVAAIFYYLATKGKLYVVPSTEIGIGCAGILLLAAWGLALALLTSPLSTYTRDVRLSFGYVTQFWYFVTPIAYPISSLPPKYQPIAEFNPLTAPVEMIKYGFLQTAPPTTGAYISCFVGLGAFVSFALWLFTRFERAAVERL